MLSPARANRGLRNYTRRKSFFKINLALLVTNTELMVYFVPLVAYALEISLLSESSQLEELDTITLCI